MREQNYLIIKQKPKNTPSLSVLIFWLEKMQKNVLSIIAARDLQCSMVAVYANIGILLHICPAVLKLYDGAVSIVYRILYHIERVINMMYRVIYQAAGHTVYTRYSIVVSLAVVAFFAAAIGHSQCNERQEHSLFHSATKAKNSWLLAVDCWQENSPRQPHYLNTKY
jgi:hypothetical protein